MEYRIINIYSSQGVTVNYDVDYVILHSGINVLWIYANKDKITIMLSDKYYHVYLKANHRFADGKSDDFPINDDLHIRRN